MIMIERNLEGWVKGDPREVGFVALLWFRHSRKKEQEIKKER